MIAVEEALAPSRPDEGHMRRRRMVSRGVRVSLRTLAPEDLDHLSEWAENPFIERMVGSEFLNSYKQVYDKDPSFYEACLMDSTQVVLVIEANPEWARPLGLARLFNIHLLEGYAFLEVMLTDAKALRRGFGVEAGKLISYYGVDVLGLRRIEAKVYEYNRLSANSLRRNGFRQVEKCVTSLHHVEDATIIQSWILRGSRCLSGKDTTACCTALWDDVGARASDLTPGSTCLIALATMPRSSAKMSAI